MFINIRVIIRLLAILLLISCSFMLPCVIMAAHMQEFSSLKAFGISYMFVIPAILILVFLKRSELRLGVRDGFLLVFLSWLSLAFFSSTPFYFSGSVASFADAFFEGAAGVTATGGSVIPDVERLDMSILLWRSVCVWMGGVGVVMLSVAIMPLLGFGGLQLVKAEKQGIDNIKVTSRFTSTARALWIIYVIFTVICFSLYKFGGLSTFDSVNLALCSISSGGFSTYNGGVSYFDTPFIQWVTAGAMFASGVSFTLYARLFTGRVVSFFKNSELRAYIFIIISAALVIAWVNKHHGLYSSLEENFRYAFFHVVSLISSTGYALADWNQWPGLSKFILFTLVFVGGCAGSTAGGFKIVRVVILCKQAINEMKRMVHPRGIFLIRLNGHSMDKSTVFSVSSFFFLYIFSVIVVSLVASTATDDMMTALSIGFAIVGNTGTGFNGIGPMDTYFLFPEYVKWVLSIGMIVGRLELYAFFVLFMPFFWKRH